MAALNPHSFDPTLRVGYNGDITGLVEEQESLITDLEASGAIVMLLVAVALWIFFRHWEAIFAILGLFPWRSAAPRRFGISYHFVVGQLNVNTAFLGSIVLGNGINVAIIIVARYLEERRNGIPVDRAIEISWRRTLVPTFVAAFSQRGSRTFRSLPRTSEGSANLESSAG